MSKGLLYIDSNIFVYPVICGPDAIHAATALENKITTLVSYDKDFDNMNEIKRIEP